MKQLQSHLKETNALEHSKADQRPFVAVQLLELLVKGLLDSGAAVSCLGGNLAREFLPSSVRTFFIGWDTTQSGQGPLQLNL